MAFDRIASIFRPFVLLQSVEPKTQDVIKKFELLHKKAKRFIDTFHVDHKAAYLKGAEHLRDKEGLIDYEKLDDAGTQKKFVDDLAKVYEEKARKYLTSSSKPDDEFANAMMMQAVYNTSRDELKHEIAKKGKGYTVEHHRNVAKDLMGEVTKRIGSIPSTAIGKDDVEKIIEYTGVKRDAEKMGYELKKDTIAESPPVAAALLETYLEHGGLTKDTFEHFSPMYFKKKRLCNSFC